MDFSFINTQPKGAAPQSGANTTSAASGAVTSAPKKTNTAFEQKARDTADSFEAMFLAQYLNTMSAGIQTDGTFGGGHGEEMFKSVLNDEMAKSITSRGGIGLSDVVYREILKTQEVAPAPTHTTPTQK